MTNKQYPVISALKTLIQAISGIYFVGEYPDDLSKIGQRFPAVILEDGNETYDVFPGNQYKCFMEVRVNLFVHMQQGQTKIKSLTDLQADINDAVLADLTVTSTCVNITLTEVRKDEVTNEAGEQIARRVITYLVEIHDTRV